MIKYEYKTISSAEELNGSEEGEMSLNSYGAKGWELVSVTSRAIRGIIGLEFIFTYYFKRPYEEKEQCEESKKTQKETSEDGSKDGKLPTREAGKEEKK